MSKDMIELVAKIAEMPPEKRKDLLIFGQGLAAGIELAAAGNGDENKAEKTAAAGTGEDLSTASRSPSPEGEAEDGGAA